MPPCGAGCQPAADWQSAIRAPARTARLRLRLAALRGGLRRLTIAAQDGIPPHKGVVTGQRLPHLRAISGLASPARRRRFTVSTRIFSVVCRPRPQFAVRSPTRVLPPGGVRYIVLSKVPRPRHPPGKGCAALDSRVLPKGIHSHGAERNCATGASYQRPDHHR